MDKPYTSAITHVVDATGWTQQDKLYFYWSKDKAVEETQFVAVEEAPHEEAFVFRYLQENEKPETIYLHVKKLIKGITTYEKFKTNYYINKPSSIEMKVPEVLTIEAPELMVDIRANEYTKLKAVYVQLSDNVLGVSTAKELLQYRILKSFSDGESSRRNFKINLDDYNVGDGRYYLKITAMDTSGKVTVQYSDVFVVDFGLIRRAVSFDTPIIGPDGQLLPSNSMRVTGDLLIRFELDDDAIENETLESRNMLTFFGTELNMDKLTTRRFDGEIVEGVQYVASEQANVFKLNVSWNLPNDWYYIYEGDALIGMFLCQISRR